ncbi:hypothetical protein C8R45DRAFT_1108169 [Mycena sanguinolenta]|nr:hypothetical protein C8R45DRAFT_1108169 [Mycena sanguinolenta]
MGYACAKLEARSYIKYKITCSAGVETDEDKSTFVTASGITSTLTPAERCRGFGGGREDGRRRAGNSISVIDTHPPISDSLASACRLLSHLCFWLWHLDRRARPDELEGLLVDSLSLTLTLSGSAQDDGWRDDDAAADPHPLATLVPSDQRRCARRSVFRSGFVFGGVGGDGRARTRHCTARYNPRMERRGNAAGNDRARATSQPLRSRVPRSHVTPADVARRSVASSALPQSQSLHPIFPRPSPTGPLNHNANSSQ